MRWEKNDIVFVADFGRYGKDNDERGVFKTIDGGKSWKKVLFRNAKTGAIDVAIGAAIEQCLAGELLGAERDQVALVAETFARRRPRLDQFAVGGENCRRPVEIREQPLRAVG